MEVEGVEDPQWCEKVSMVAMLLTPGLYFKLIV